METEKTLNQEPEVLENFLPLPGIWEYPDRWTWLD